MTGSEHEEQASRAHEPTTMRLPASADSSRSTRVPRPRSP